MAKTVIAQNGVAKTNDKDWAYYHYRTKISEPDYSLKKVRELISTIKTKGYGSNHVLENKTYESLKLREKFTYNMIHAESYGQICSLFPIETDAEKKIFAQLPDVFGEDNWSSHQIDFFKSNKDSVIELMSNSILISKRIGLNYKSVIEMINATRTIPLLIEVYAIDKEDHDILTLLMLLMKNNEYTAFMNSPIYKTLYESDQSSYRTSLPLTFPNEKEIIRLANNFFYELPK